MERSLKISPFLHQLNGITSKLEQDEMTQVLESRVTSDHLQKKGDDADGWLVSEKEDGETSILGWG